MDRPVDETDNSSPEKIQEELVAINDCKYTGNELYFDPVDGQLKVIKKSAERPSPDSKVITEIAEWGFFMN